MPDPDRMPDWRRVEIDVWAVRSGYFHINRAFVFSVDNLIDFSHIGYMNATTIGSSGDAE